MTRDPDDIAKDGLQAAGLYGGTIPFVVLIDSGMVIDSTYVGGGFEATIEERIEALIDAREVAP